MKAAIDLLVRGQELPAELMREVMLSLMRGEADPAAVGAFLTALTIKGESVAEVTAAAPVMRALAPTFKSASVLAVEGVSFIVANLATPCLTSGVLTQNS